MEESRDTWKSAFQKLYQQRTADTPNKDLEECNTKVQELQDQLQREQEKNAGLQSQIKKLQSEEVKEMTPQTENQTKTQMVAPQVDEILQPQEGDQHIPRELTLNNIQKEVTELRQKVVADRVTINFLEERNKELRNRKPPSSLSSQLDNQITLSSEEWDEINAAISQAKKYFIDLFEEAEASKLYLPHRAKDYRTVLKEFEAASKQLKDHSDSQEQLLQKHLDDQPPPPICPQIGDSQFQFDAQRSRLFKHFKEILQDPERPGFVDVTNAQMPFDKKGLGLDTDSQSFSGRRTFSYESLIPSTSIEPQ
ncbi:hypothetical protein L7F22_065995 [Adiantum nelumboides]|nr:hypothetical protein [Adiantum nelumboides]